ncbi:MAG: cell wall-active antibiotics response protein [Melioribacteraceae bacterium]|nr:cell wall-active antibiotics response protein [Melioribacteraceae bacterium]MCF8264786.1 cell wall-active antibiotics response protein [Melioribacteraceae bacterium]MCF8413959.1 cell wall-active antibiotics response protein [Melioribacteraceae bacterium]
MKWNDSRSILGSIFIGWGLLLIIDKIFYLDLFYYIFSIPTLFIGIGIIIYFNSKNKVVSGSFIGLGAAMLVAYYFGYTFWEVLGQMWPLILIGIGAYFILKRNESKNGEPYPKDAESDSAENDQSEFEYIALFTSVRRKVESRNLVKIDAISIFGGTNVDLTEAGMQGKEVTFDSVSIFGGCDIRLPREWKLIDNTISIFGGTNDKRIFSSEEKNEKTIVINGVSIFGGINYLN